MTQSLTPIKRVAIVGGGIAGLSTAYALVEEAKSLGQSIECIVLEAQAHWGGKFSQNALMDWWLRVGQTRF